MQDAWQTQQQGQGASVRGVKGAVATPSADAATRGQRGLLAWQPWTLGVMGALAVSVATAQSAAPDALANYGVQMPLTVTGPGPWYRLELPTELRTAAAHPDVRDLRIFDANGQQLAHALAPAAEQHLQREHTTTVRTFPLFGDTATQSAPSGVRVRRDEGGTVVEVLPERAANTPEPTRGWLLDASAVTDPLQRLTLAWQGGPDGFQRFSIEASDDLLTWRRWGEGQVARLAFEGEQMEQREVALPGQRARYLRLLWPAGQQAPQLTQATLTSATGTAVAPRLDWFAAPQPPVQADGSYQWTLPAALSLARLRVGLADGNVLVPVSVSGRLQPRDPWTPLARDVLSRLPVDGVPVLRDEIVLPGRSVRELQLRADTRAGALADPPSLSWAVRALDVVFLARDAGPYVLAVHRPDAPAVDLPLATLMTGQSATSLERLDVATPAQPFDPATQRASTPTPAPSDTLDWKRIGLWAALLAGVGLLAAMAWSLVRKGAPAPRPPDDPPPTN